MLNIIEPKDHHLHTSKISSLFSLLKIYQNFSLPMEELEDATFIIAENKKFGVYGGAVVFPQNIKDLYPKLASAFLEFLPENDKIWSVRLCFCLDQGERFLTLEGLEICEKFYQDLHQSLQEVGQKKGIHYFALTLQLGDYRNTLTYGRWNYLLDVPSSESSDYRFHGLLVLKNKEVFESDNQEEDFDLNDQDYTDRRVQ